MKYWIKMALATSLAGGLIGLYFLDEKWSQEKKDTERVEHSALSFEEPAVRRIRIVSKAGALAFERGSANTDWGLAEPSLALKLEQSAVSQFLSSLSALTTSLEISGTESVVQGAEKALYGFESPLATVEIGLENKTLKTLIVGADMEIGERTGGKFESQAVYAMNSERKLVFVMSKPSVEFLKKSMADFRTKSPVDFDVASVHSFSLQVSNVDQVKISKDSNTWKITAPREIVADQTAVASYLNVISRLKVGKVTEKEMLGAGGGLAAFGLDKPAAVARFDDSSGNALAIVRMGKVKNAHFIQMADGAVGSLAETAYSEAAPALKYFRDKRVMRDANMSDVFQIKTAAGRVFQKEGGSWYSLEPEPLSSKGAADSKSGVASTPNSPVKVAIGGAATLFSDWEFLAADDVLDGPELKSMSLYGLQKPTSRFTFIFAQGKAPAEEILIGNKVPNNPKLVYVKRSNGSAVYLVDAGWLENLAKLDNAKAQTSK